MLLPKTTRLISEKFNSIEQNNFSIKIWSSKWLEPYTDKTLEKLPKDGKKMYLQYVLVFLQTRVETLEEILIQGKESF